VLFWATNCCHRISTYFFCSYTYIHCCHLLYTECIATEMQLFRIFVKWKIFCNTCTSLATLTASYHFTRKERFYDEFVVLAIINPTCSHPDYLHARGWGYFSSQNIFTYYTPLSQPQSHFIPSHLWRWNRHSVLIRWHLNYRRRGITQKKAYDIQNTAKIWNKENST
jgi:hypothetical protein